MMGTALDHVSPCEQIVSPAVVPEVIATAHRYGAHMVKIFPAALGGPKYMANLRMVFPEVSLVPSGGISPENAGEFIKCGASAVSGPRNFFNREAVEREGSG
jgi:2-dehydro-3-deoxyphosphogluconate aldolase/(4S)-4-hydroxy-2-oxoglutarate aldolase